ncbi:Uncharacterized protein dnm_022810 [Desulfonema magnum]|uniref:Uncharacterized protein n=1 Tax=Desulfonema magnum TaxID=45655 RepID=A0A975BJH9_9BACT|nr:Uncharacterized protein dnm_022810 [Desulfonema magnum]
MHMGQGDFPKNKIPGNVRWVPLRSTHPTFLYRVFYLFRFP